MNTGYSLQFTEEMKGWFGWGESDYQRGVERGRKAENSVMFHLTIVVEDVHRFVGDPTHAAHAHGWVASDVLGGRLPVQSGLFNLFVTDGPGKRRMLYRLFFADSVGHPLTLTGFKDIHGGSPMDVWPETSTLYTTILRGHVEDGGEGALVGSGMLRILPQDFARQLTTFRVSGPGLRGRGAALGEFLQLFLGQLWTVFSRGGGAGRGSRGAA